MLLVLRHNRRCNATVENRVSEWHLLGITCYRFTITYMAEDNPESWNCLFWFCFLSLLKKKKKMRCTQNNSLRQVLYLCVYLWPFPRSYTFTLFMSLFLSSALRKQTKGAGSYPCPHSLPWLKGIKVAAVGCGLIDHWPWDSPCGTCPNPRGNEMASSQTNVVFCLFYGKMTDLSDTPVPGYKHCRRLWLLCGYFSPFKMLLSLNLSYKV